MKPQIGATVGPAELEAPPVQRPARSVLGPAAALVTADAAALSSAALVAFALGILASPVLTGSVYVAFGTALAGRWEVFLVGAFVTGGWLHLHGHYSERVPLWTELRDLLRVGGMMLLLEGFLQFAIKADISRVWIVVTWALFPGFAVLFRSAAKRTMTRAGSWLIPTIVFGRTEDAAPVAEALVAEPMLGFDVVAVRGPSNPDAALADMRRSGARFAVLVQSDGRDAGTIALARTMSQDGVPFAIAPPFAGLALAGMRSQFIFGHDVVLLMERGGLLRRPAQMLKRAFDLAASGAALIVLVPVFGILARMAKADGGPALFGHERVGRGGATFRCLKFRTMVEDAETRLKDLLESDPAARDEWERYHKLRNDPRLTRWGALMRRTSLDELPQLYNVLRGDMSLVGPRPPTKAELSRYGEDVAFLLKVRPGITGLWQVSGRNDTDFARRVALDSWYVRNWSFGYDLLIAVLTIPVLISRRGAY
jgi:undecaprenyl-phosphate galactose phosphotransferase